VLLSSSPALSMFLLLVLWHYLADYPLQGDFIARAKNPVAPIDGVPWMQVMIAHCAIHAAGAGFVTDSLWVVVVEFVTHGVTDYAKCRGWIDYNVDQGLHLGLKFLYVAVLVAET
jgi:hypothetical protein